MSLLETLPDLPLDRILNKLDQNDVINCRVASPILKSRVDGLYKKWNIWLNMACPEELAFKFTLKVKELHIVHLRRDQPNLPRLGPEGTVLKYPENLELLECGHLSQGRILEEIRPEDLDSLLTSSNNLRTLIFLFPALTLVTDYFSTISCNFPHLTTLHLEITKGPSGPEIPDLNLYTRLLLHSQMPNVSSLSLSLYDVGFKRLTAALFTFIERHGPLLKHLKFGTKALDLLDPADRKAGIEFEKACTTLDSLELQAYNRIPFKLSWSEFIQNQKNLKTLRINAVQLFSSLSLQLLPPISGTLTSLRLDKLKLNNDQYPYNNFELDMGAFGICANLKSLRIKVKESILPTATNLTSLPQGLVEFKIENVRIAPEDLLEFTANTRLSKLKIGDAKHILPSGLTGGTLRQLMDGDTMTKIGFKWGDVVGDPTDLLHVCWSTGYPDTCVFDGVDGFRILRENPASGWQLDVRGWS